MYDNPQFYSSHYQASATALGLAACGPAAGYLSVAGHANAVQSLWAAVVQRNSGVWATEFGTYARLSLIQNAARKKFTSSIPNSSYVHGVFVADAPNIVMVTDPRGARLDAYYSQEREQRDALLGEHKEQFYRDFIAALASMPSVETPLLPEWGEPLWKAVLDGGFARYCSGTAPVSRLDTYGDCLLAVQINPAADWNTFIVRLLNEGALQTQ